MTTLTDQILFVAAGYCQGAACTLDRASQRSLGDSRRLPRLAERTGSITLDRADRAMAWFSAHWPASVVWPAGVPRPAAEVSP